MSQTPQPPSPYGPSPGARDPSSRRPASVNLRGQTEETADVAALMDPATRSLADALRITYRLVQLAMVGLAVLFLLSGLQSVKEGERALRLVFGRIEADDLPPGFQLTLPTPIGELIKVSTGAETLKLDRDFWPSVAEGDRSKSPAELKNVGKGSLDPAADGSLITADGNLAHARFSITYRREVPRDWAAHIRPEDEARLIRSAVMQGVVHAAAGLSIDEMLKNVPDADRKGVFIGLASRAKAVAQRTLAQNGSGITILDLLVQEPTPPLNLITKFDMVQSSQSDAKKKTEEAEQERVKTLTSTAGEAAPVLLELIDRYDRALAKVSKDDPEAVLTQINNVMDGHATADAAGVEASRIGLVSGKVAQTLAEAREYRSSVVSRSAADANLFDAKRAAFLKNPSVLVAGDWSEAFAAFMAHDNVELIMLPPGANTIEVLLNRDPELTRAREIAKQHKEAEDRNNQTLENQRQLKVGNPSARNPAP